MSKEPSEGVMVSHGNVVWIEANRNGSFWRTEPAWSGMFKCLRAKRYARKHEIKLDGKPLALKPQVPVSA